MLTDKAQKSLSHLSHLQSWCSDLEVCLHAVLNSSLKLFCNSSGTGREGCPHEVLYKEIVVYFLKSVLLLLSRGMCLDL